MGHENILSFISAMDQSEAVLRDILSSMPSGNLGRAYYMHSVWVHKAEKDDSVYMDEVVVKLAACFAFRQEIVRRLREGADITDFGQGWMAEDDE